MELTIGWLLRRATGAGFYSGVIGTGKRAALKYTVSVKKAWFFSTETELKTFLKKYKEHGPFEIYDLKAMPSTKNKTPKNVVPLTRKPKPKVTAKTKPAIKRAGKAAKPAKSKTTKQRG